MMAAKFSGMNISPPVRVGLAWTMIFAPVFLLFLWYYNVAITFAVVAKLFGLSLAGGLAFGFLLLSLGRRSR